MKTNRKCFWMEQHLHAGREHCLGFLLPVSWMQSVCKRDNWDASWTCSLLPINGVPNSNLCVCLSGLLCFLIGTLVILMHGVRPALLKAFFDLCEDEEEDEGLLGEVYINPYIPQIKTISSPPNFRLTVKNSWSETRHVNCCLLFYRDIDCSVFWPSAGVGQALYHPIHWSWKGCPELGISHHCNPSTVAPALNLENSQKAFLPAYRGWQQCRRLHWKGYLSLVLASVNVWQKSDFVSKEGSTQPECCELHR